MRCRGRRNGQGPSPLPGTVFKVRSWGPCRLLLAEILLSASCHREVPRPTLVADASTPAPLSLRVPAALTVQRALDTLSVAIDPVALGVTQVPADPGMTLGVEAHVLVFSRGQPRPVLERRAIVPGVDFNACAATWSVAKDGIPEPNTKYGVEVQFVLFETDIPPSADWDPHDEGFKSLWTRTLRQAEE
jgi:hypothetical protein